MDFSFIFPALFLQPLVREVPIEAAPAHGISSRHHCVGRSLVWVQKRSGSGDIEKGEKHPSSRTLSSSNPPTSDILETGLVKYTNYMHGYFEPVPEWSPTFMPYQAGYQIPSNIQNVGYPFQYGMRPPRPIINTSSATSARVGDRDTPDCLETEEVVPSSDGDDIIEEPKSEMEFNSFDDLLSYYKHYAKKNGFGVMTQRSERSEDQSVTYVTLGCARGGKAQNKSLNVANPYQQERRTVRDVSETVKRVLDTNDVADIRLNKSYGSLVVGADGFENLPFLENDCRNYIHKARHLRLGAGDPRSRAAYQYFGDVVTFDTTYLTNRYGMPFAPFVSVNHHGQSILLGAGLISSEDTETFAWLFRTWLQCMDGIAPKAIITNQDRVMKNAIALVFPETRHRFCLWHILKKVPEKLGSYVAYKSGLKTGLMKCVYDTQSSEDFEKCWAEFINTFELHENAWLNSLYAERDHWTNLKEFVDQFDSALKKKIENENQAEFQSFSVTIPCVSRSPIEKKFQELYTNAKFKEVQQQVIGVLDLETSLLTSDGVLKSYLVEDEVRIQEFTKSLTYSVEFNVDDCNAKCSSGLFQMRGILCRHILAIFKSNGIKSLPDRYILDRWRKDIKRRYTVIRSSYDEGD
ncbi:protein FAR1-RELATED SEQUENCE 5-like [Carya illinoinensis]|uniref:protein FAR1-RELATED SEQUENCE 5-like n=1 Tax=Carya illinoinensis TaxID=32201 RepID=UPI001C71D2DE|nr:protein FAR1-RELATED SEQUENCE 5-like [Carya illinoinensis]